MEMVSAHAAIVDATKAATYLKRNEAGILRVHMHLGDLSRNTFRFGVCECGKLGGRYAVAGGRVNHVAPCAIG